MRENRSPIILREGAVYLDGLKIMDIGKCKITAIPELWEGRYMGNKTKDRRWIGIDYKVSLEEYTSTPWMKVALKKYIESGATPEFTVQGVRNDKNSDYYQICGSETVTATGCVITSEITLLELDMDGDVMKSAVEFGAKKVA